jgi:hypothetical protein
MASQSTQRSILSFLTHWFPSPWYMKVLCVVDTRSGVYRRPGTRQPEGAATRSNEVPARGAITIWLEREKSVTRSGRQ